MAPHSSALAWKIPWMEEPGALQFMGSLGELLFISSLALHVELGDMFHRRSPVMRTKVSGKLFKQRGLASRTNRELKMLSFLSSSAITSS